MTKRWSWSAEGLLSTGPTPSSFVTVQVHCTTFVTTYLHCGDSGIQFWKTWDFLHARFLLFSNLTVLLTLFLMTRKKLKQRLHQGLLGPCGQKCLVATSTPKKEGHPSLPADISLTLLWEKIADTFEMYCFLTISAVLHLKTYKSFIKKRSRLFISCLIMAFQKPGC